ncbi:DUF3147 family protein [Bacteroidota bacterium]
MDIFLLKLILTFITGGIWILLSTVVAEKYGTKVGGIIVGLPSTSMVALFFIGWTNSPAFASEATTLIPIIAGINAFFVVLYLMLIKRGFLLALISSLIFWLLISLFLVGINFDNFVYSLIGLAILGPLSYYILEKKSKIQSKGKIAMKYSVPQMLFRALFGGFMIALAVFLANVGGPLLGSAFVMFPALFTSTIIVTHLEHGTSFSAAIMKASVFSANINISVYGIAVRYLYPVFGLILGTIFSFTIVMFTGYLTYVYIKKKMS